MEQLNVKDMIGYKSPAVAMNKQKSDVKSNVGSLIGVKSFKFDDLPPIKTTDKSQQEADFKLKLDIHKNEESYENTNTEKDLRLEKAYSMVEQFVPGYDKAGGRWNRALAWAGSKKHKEKVKVAKRHHLVGHAINQGGNVIKATNPNIDPNLVDLGSGLAGIGANHAIDAGANKYKSLKTKWKKDKEDKAKRNSLLK